MQFFFLAKLIIDGRKGVQKGTTFWICRRHI